MENDRPINKLLPFSVPGRWGALCEAATPRLAYCWGAEGAVKGQAGRDKVNDAEGSGVMKGKVK